jgi:Mn2+/Fe2+ NRAMP family transporter
MVGVIVAASLIIVAASTGDFRRFERFSMLLVFGSLLLVPIFVIVHPPLSQIAYDFVVPQIPATDKLSDFVLLIIAVVGTTVAPWQLFFQQSYVIDKRITPRFIRYERLDLWIGIVLVIVGAVAILAFTAQAFTGTPEFGNFTDAAGVAGGLEKYAGRSVGVMFAIALIDAAMIGAAAVSLATAYAIGDVFSVRHSLHRRVSEAKGFYAVYALLIAVAAAIVLTPNAPLGLLTVAVQTLAGVLLPSAAVFLLLLCDDRAVLGPWVNDRWLNYFTGAVIAALVVLSMILTITVLFPDSSNAQSILGILTGGGVVAVIVALVLTALSQNGKGAAAGAQTSSARAVDRNAWRMPPLASLPPAKLSLAAKTWMGILRLYLVVAGGLLLIRIVSLAIGHG